MSESTVRRWCDRGVLSSQSTAGGHRRIELAALLAFARERGLALALSDQSAFGLATASDRDAVPAQLRDAFLAAVRAGDHDTASTLLATRLAVGDPPADLLDGWVGAALETVGTLWETGQIDIYEEHRATQAVMFALVGLDSLLPADRADGPRALAAALAGDHSVVAPTVVALTLRTCGYRVATLGANTPAASIARAIEDLQPKLVAISLSHVCDEDAAVEEMGIVRDATARHGALLAVGGRGSAAQIRRRLDADFFGDTLAHLARFAERVGQAG